MSLLGEYQQVLTAKDRLGVGQRGCVPRCVPGASAIWRNCKAFWCILVRDGADLEKNHKRPFSSQGPGLCAIMFLQSCTCQ